MTTTAEIPILIDASVDDSLLSSAVSSLDLTVQESLTIPMKTKNNASISPMAQSASVTIYHNSSVVSNLVLIVRRIHQIRAILLILRVHQVLQIQVMQLIQVILLAHPILALHPTLLIHRTQATLLTHPTLALHPTLLVLLIQPIQP